MEIFDLGALLRENSYPGRGIVLGRSADDKNAVIAYFIMGRSENSRNRIFSETEDGIRTEAFDPSKMVDPSLIIYHPVRAFNGATIVTNGPTRFVTVWQQARAILKRCAPVSLSRTARTTPRAFPALSSRTALMSCRFSRALTAIRLATSAFSLNTMHRVQVWVISSILTRPMAIRCRPLRASRRPFASKAI